MPETGPVVEQQELLDELKLYTRVIYDGNEYTIRMINRKTGDLLGHPVKGGAHCWFNVDDSVALATKED